jgi:NAD(P)-dependent dehydrogenase (short-subunit alcohol dehydrogenase family)
MQLNVQGTMLPTKVISKVMIAQKKGVILNISSMAASRPLTRVVGYAASKAAIDNFTKWMAVELATKYSPDIRVNAIAPGFFIGDQNRRLLLNEDGSLTDRANTIIGHTPMNRFGNPDDLIGSVKFLLSDESKFVTGIILPIDGGFSAFSGV